MGTWGNVSGGNMRKIHFKRILAMFLTAIMLLQDTQDLLVYAADFASNVPRYVNFLAPDALEDATDVISLEDEQKPLDEGEKDALVEEQSGTEQTEAATEAEESSETTESTETTEKEDTESTVGTETVEETEVNDTEVTTETEKTTETEVVEETTETEEATETTEKEVLELREPELEKREPQPGEIVSYTEDSITYAIGEGKYQTIFGGNVGTYVDEQGNVQLADDTLQEITSFGVDGGGVYTNTANDYVIVIPEKMTATTGMLLEQDGYVMEVLPLDGDYSKAVVKENAILYNDVYENIDVQYTVQGKNIKEDIILRERTEKNTFSYAVRAEGLTVQLDGQIVVLTDNEGVQRFALAAPLMTDANNEVSLGVVLSLEEQDGETILTVTADAEWLADENRAYPVKIDPSQIYLEPDKFGLYCVEEGSPNSYIGDNNYPYVGYDDGIVSGNLANYGSAHLRCRTYVDINYDFSDLGEEAQISSAELRISQSTAMSGGGKAIVVCTIDEEWEPQGMSWNDQLGMLHSTLDVQYTTSSAREWIEFDITDYVNDEAQGISASDGLLLKYDDEFDQCEVFYNRKSSTYGPQIVVNWGEGDDSALAELDIDDLTINVRPISSKSISGSLQFLGVFIDGLAKAEAMVVYNLGGIGGDTTTALPRYAYPNSLELTPVFDDGTKYKSKESNWQSHLYTAPNLAFNNIYLFSATAELDGEVSQTKYSDSFVIYKATSHDTFPKIAAYYKVSLGTLLRDNRAHDSLIMAGNTIFVRNPGTTKPYVSSGLTEEEKRQIDGKLLGRGEHCVFGNDPINYNTGNYYMNQEDVAIPDIGGDFTITRSYNSIGAKINSVFGYGWSFDYDEYLSLNADASIQYKRGDGSYLYFTKNADGSYQAPTGYEYTLKPVYRDGSIAGWSIADSAYTIKNFDTYGMLSSVTDRHGNTTTISYDGSWHISSITSPSGETYQFTTDEEGRITAILLPSGATLAYTYDNNGNLTAYTNANGNTVRYEYDSNHYMVSWSDANGNRIVANQYDAKGRVVAQTDGEGYTSTLVYGDNQTTVTDNKGNVATYYFNSNHYTTKIVYADGSVEMKSYNADNQLASETDKAGNTTSYTYDERGNLLTTTRADGAVSYKTYDAKNQMLSETDYNGNTTYYSYDDRGNLTTVIYADGSTEYYTYDSSNRLIQKTDANGVKESYTYAGAMPATYTDGEGNTYTYTYNALNQLVEEKDALGNRIVHVYDAQGREIQTVAKDGGSTVYEFDAAGNVLSITDARGKKTSFTYDKMNHILSGTDPLGQKLVYAYDKNYNKTQEINALGGTTTYAYDVMNRLVAETDAAGNATTYVYDSLGNLIKVTDANGNSRSYTYDTVKGVCTSETDANGNTTYYTYDANGNLTKTTYADGSTEHYTYDGRNRIATSTTVLGLQTSYAYDGVGNIVRTENSLGEVTAYQYNANHQMTAFTNALSHTEYYSYDAVGNLVAYTDANGAKETYAYDAAGRRILTVDANGGSTSVAYDLNGNVTSITDAKGNTTTYTYDAINQRTSETKANGAITAYFYDALQRPVKVIDALKGETTYTYDAVGNILTTVDANGNQYNYSYDSVYQVTKLTLPNGGVNTMSYDAAGNLLETTDAAGLKTSYVYDVRNRVIAQSDNTGVADSYVLDAAGNILKKTDALGRVTSYEYDTKGRQTAVTEADGSITAYSYNAVDALIRVTDAMGHETGFAYDAAGNNTAMSQSDDKVYRYTYDKLHNLTCEMDPLGGKTTYLYDAVGNLVSVTDAHNNTVSYTYNAVSNLTSETDGNGNVTSYEYDALDRLTLKTDALGATVEYRYDAIGNLTKYKDENGYITEYRYDSMSNMVQSISPLRAVVKYTYDAHGNVTSQTDANGNVTHYDVDLNSNVIKLTQADGGIYTYAYDVAGRMVSATTPLNYTVEMTYDAVDNLIKETDSLGRVTTYEYDRLHNMTKTVDAEGGVSVYSYDAYGNLTSEADPLGRTTTYSYDLCDRMTEMYDPLQQLTTVSYDPVGNVTDITTPGGRTTAYSYDGNYNTTAVTDPMGYATGYIYDQKNQLTSEVDALSQSNAYAYDALGQLVTYIDRRGNSEHYRYDAHGNQTVYTDFAGKVTHFTYDLNNNLTIVEDAGGGRTYYGYDSMNRMVSYTNALGETTRYTYDYMGNQTSIINADGRVETNIYDEAGRLVEYVKNSKKSIQYDYDKLNNLVEKSYYNSKGDESEKGILYGYNANGERVSMMDLSGESTYEYDALGRITKVTNGAGKVVTYAYDKAGNLTRLGYPDGTAVFYTYDLNNNITSVTEPDGDVTRYEYDALNRLTATYRPDRTATYMTYDEESNLTVLSNVCTHCKELLSEFHYTYNEMGYVVSEEMTERISVYCGRYHGHKQHGNFWRGKGHEQCKHEWFEYDDKGIEERIEEVNALVEETSLIASANSGSEYAGAEHGGEGRHGGRWHKHPAVLYCTCHTKLVTTTKSYVYDSNWQILSCTTEADDKEITKECFSYDSAGNRISYELWSGHAKVQQIRYEYNSANQLVTTYEKDGLDWFTLEKTVYDYDKDGNLISETIVFKWDWNDDWNPEDDGWWDDDWWEDWFESGFDEDWWKDWFKNWFDGDWWEDWFDDWIGDGWPGDGSWDDWFDGIIGGGWLAEGIRADKNQAEETTASDFGLILSVGEEAEEEAASVESAAYGFDFDLPGFGDKEADKKPDEGKPEEGDKERPELPDFDMDVYSVKTYKYDTENRLKAVTEQGILLQAMTYDGDGNLAYQMDYNVEAEIDARCIYLPIHGNDAERELYKQVADSFGWVKGDYTLTAYINDVTQEHTQVLAEYGRNYCSMTVYTYGNDLIASTTFNGYGYHFGCHHDGFFHEYDKWHDRWHIGEHGKPGHTDKTNLFEEIYGTYSSHHSHKGCGHNWLTTMSKVYYIYDGHGSVERIHGKDGSTFKMKYDTFGNLVAGIVDRWHVWHNNIFAHRTMNLYAYSGERYNCLSELQYLRARWYDTELGRFISEDSYLGTQTEPLTRNRYAYTCNNPVNYVDPSGHMPVDTIFDILSALGSLYEVLKNPFSLENWGYLGLDAFSIFAPYIPGSYAVKGVGTAGKALESVGTAADIGKTANKIGNGLDAANDATKGIDYLKDAENAVSAAKDGMNAAEAANKAAGCAGKADEAAAAIKSGLDVNLLDDMGKFADDTLENNYQAYVNRKINKGQTPKDRLEWKEASDYWTKESPVARGNNFNKTVREADIYDYHEVYLENGKRLDSYDPDAGEIISRKATDLDKITEETYRGYLSEFSQKYSEGTKIRSNAYPELDGQELKGQYILEIPASNADISNIDYYKQIAAEYDVILRFMEEVQ